MKTFLGKYSLSFLFVSLAVLIFVFGGLYSRYMTNQIGVHSEDQIGISLDYYTYNFELSTFIESPYLAHVTYGSDHAEAFVYLTKQYHINGVVSGIEIPITQLSNLQLLIDQMPPTYDTSTYFSNYVEATNTFTVVTQGFQDIIEIEVVFNATFSSVDSYTISSTETYYYASNYIGGMVPYVENYYLDGFANGDTDLEAVAGASVGTCPAMQRAVDLLDLLQIYKLSQTIGNLVYSNQNGGN